MNRRSSGVAGTARLAVVGAQTPEGGHLRAELAAYGVPGNRVNLFGFTSGEAVLSEYDGEARLIQEPEPAEVVGHDVVFLCERREIADRILAKARPEAILIDVAALTVDRDDVPLVHPGVTAPESIRGKKVVAMPHALSALLTGVLHPLHRELGPGQVTAVVLRPAADFGEPGLEELREQTVRLFNFSAVPKETFGAQLSFNVIPQRHMTKHETGLDRRVVREVDRLLGWPAKSFALRIINVPVFHGHAAYVRIVPDRPAAAGDLIAVLEEEAGIEVGIDEGGTPMEVAGERETRVTEVTEDGGGGFWLWVVAGEAGGLAARQAVRLASDLADL